MLSERASKPSRGVSGTGRRGEWTTERVWSSAGAWRGYDRPETGRRRPLKPWISANSPPNGPSRV